MKFHFYLSYCLSLISRYHSKTQLSVKFPTNEHPLSNSLLSKLYLVNPLQINPLFLIFTEEDGRMLLKLPKVKLLRNNKREGMISVDLPQ